MSVASLLDAVRPMLPNLLGLALVTGMLGSAVWAVRGSPNDSARDRHFVLLLSVLSVGAAFVVGLVARLGTGVISIGDRITSDWMVGAIGLAWVLGSACVTVRLTVGWIAASVMVWGGERADGRHEVLVRRAAGHVGLARIPEIVFSRHCRMPLATGVLHPAVLLPMELAEAEERDLWAVLTHELAHIHRRDCLAEVGVQAVGALMWWNPLFWMAARELRLLREIICDDVVVFGACDRRAYGSLLARFASGSRLPLGPGLAGVAMSSRRTLARRLRALGPDEPGGRPSRWPGLLPATLTNQETTSFVLWVLLVAASMDLTLVALAAECGAPVAMPGGY